MFVCLLMTEMGIVLVEVYVSYCAMILFIASECFPISTLLCLFNCRLVSKIS